MANIELVRTYTFEGAHRLPKVAPEHKCARLHGHSFKVELRLSGPLDDQKGWLMDYAEIDEIFDPLWQQLDHHYLNDIEGLDNPTSENLAIWIWNHLKPKLPELEATVVHETCEAHCIYKGT